MQSKSNVHEWTQIMNEWKESGQTRKQFCTANKLKVSTFDYWRSRLKKAGLSPKTLIKVPLQLNAPSSSCRLVIDQSHTLEFPETIDAGSLKRIVSALKESL